VATLYWNGTAGALQEERHTAYRNLAMHDWAHDTIGSRIMNDGSFSQTQPTIANPAKLELTGGYLFDEDLITDITTAKAKLARHWYQTAAAAWTFADGVDNAGFDFPFLWNSDTSRLRFPNSASSYALADVNSNGYIALFVYASNDVARPIYIVTPALATASTTLANARLIPVPAVPLPELKLLWKWIFKGDGAYAEGVDYRTSSSLPGGGFTAPPALTVSFSPAGNIAALNVQEAIEELDAEKPQLVTAPAAADSTGTAGQIAYADGFLYVCIAPNTWQRAVLATWGA
jgi:hypothetical protein